MEEQKMKSRTHEYNINSAIDHLTMERSYSN